MDITAVAAMPFDLGVLFKDFAFFNVLEQCPIAFFVLFFHFGNFLEDPGNLIKTFFFGNTFFFTFEFGFTIFAVLTTSRNVVLQLLVVILCL